MNDLLKSLNWRYATKKFDATAKISEENIEILKEAIRLSASSFGLQPYEVLIIEDKEIRNKLRPASWDQSQITDASHLFVFSAKTDVSNDDIDGYIKNASQTRNIAIENLEGYGDFMKSKIVSLDTNTKTVWSTKQTYIALGNLLAACGQLQIDSCPMEGFDPVMYDEILNLKEKGLTSAVVVAVGYRAEEDQTQHLVKVRKSTQELFTTI